MTLALLIDLCSAVRAPSPEVVRVCAACVVAAPDRASSVLVARELEVGKGHRRPECENCGRPFRPESSR